MLNWCLFFAVIQTSQCHKIITQFLSMPTEKKPIRKLQFHEYTSKKQMYNLMSKSKDKTTSLQYRVATLESDHQLFICNSQINNSTGFKGGSYTLTSPAFWQLLTDQSLLGERTFLSKLEVYVQTIVWESYSISHIELPTGDTLMIIKEINTTDSVSTGGNYISKVYQKICKVFSPLLEMLFGMKRSEQLLRIYLQELEKQLNDHNQLKVQVKCEDTSKNLYITNFQLLEMGKICRCLMNE